MLIFTYIPYSEVCVNERIPAVLRHACVCSYHLFFGFLGFFGGGRTNGDREIVMFLPYRVPRGEPTKRTCVYSIYISSMAEEGDEESFDLYNVFVIHTTVARVTKSLCSKVDSFPEGASITLVDAILAHRTAPLFLEGNTVSGLRGT